MVSKRIVLHFPPKLVDQPIVYRLIRDFNLEFNILKAYVTPKEEGLLVLEVQGEKKDYDKGIRYLKEAGVKIQPLSQDVSRIDKKCTHCGVCVPICPTQALVLDIKTREVLFLKDKCIACGFCVKACPTRAMEIRF